MDMDVCKKYEASMFYNLLKNLTYTKSNSMNNSNSAPSSSQKYGNTSVSSFSRKSNTSSILPRLPPQSSYTKSSSSSTKNSNLNIGGIRQISTIKSKASSISPTTLPISRIFTKGALREASTDNESLHKSTSYTRKLNTDVGEDLNDKNYVEDDTNIKKNSPTTTILPSIITSKVVVVLCCDKCDGKHHTDDCPYYKKDRESHPDAQKNIKALGGGTSLLPGARLRLAKVIKQPGDGSCLFHSISYSLQDGSTAYSLRQEICQFIINNPHYKINDTSLSDWIRWDSGSTCREYALRMSRGAWGGGIEMAIASILKGVNVHVYESSLGGYKRISAFDMEQEPEMKRTVRILYCGGVHYGTSFS